MTREAFAARSWISTGNPNRTSRLGAAGGDPATPPPHLESRPSGGTLFEGRWGGLRAVAFGMPLKNEDWPDDLLFGTNFRDLSGGLLFGQGLIMSRKIGDFHLLSPATQPPPTPMKESTHRSRGQSGG